jgi:osmotically-inducible protein OsmY
MHARLSAAAAIALLTLGSAAAAQDLRDARVAADVSAAIRSYPQFTIFDDLAGRVEAGHVTLTGRVTTPVKKREIAARVARVEGVREVRNEIGVLPASFRDDDLRRRIAHAIYGNPSFWSYAAMSNPPIHIIVENGHVTLTGVVNSHTERAIARSLATGRGELSVANELRTAMQ